ncbi:NUDIX hydrolase [uncultured Traorella sp.]|uniref:NUDIX hydrolase n=1 Tax=uncultured Traorella sp. TaxID=1929048 RepID=UPI0025DB8E78|nr:NUDIX hydrolase [uncultured Traorella sp.]
MELWDLYDENENLLGKKHERGKELPEGCYHLVIHVWTFSKGKLLVTQRDPKKPYGEKWEVTGGSVLANETAVEGAIRELREETGIRCVKDELELFVTKIEGCCIYKSFILVKEIDPAVLKCQEGETIDIKFVNRWQWLAMIENDEVAKPIVRHYHTYQKELDKFFQEEDR